MTLAEWITFNEKEGIYRIGNEIIVVGQKKRFCQHQ